MTRVPGVRSIRVALAGCGTVGGALLDLLERHGAELAASRGVRFEVVRILVRDAARPRALTGVHGGITDCVREFVAEPCEVVVEALNGLDPATEVARASLAAGRGLVTANKALMRAQGPALAALAREHARGALRFEASVGGGVPIVRVLRDSLAGHGVEEVRGVLNGTTNYILSRIEAGATFVEALKDAQRAGFAEADPVRDLSGADAADKIALIAWLAFGADPRSVGIDRRGLPEDPGLAVRLAAVEGRRLRLVAGTERRNGEITAYVRPESLAPDDPLAGARDEQNVIQVRSRSAGTITLSGRGAGGHATASALLADLIHLSAASAH